MDALHTREKWEVGTRVSAVKDFTILQLKIVILVFWVYFVWAAFQRQNATRSRVRTRPESTACNCHSSRLSKLDAVRQLWLL